MNSQKDRMKGNQQEILSKNRKPTNMQKGFNIRNFIKEGEMTEEEIDKCEFWVNANRIIRESKKENHEEAKIPVNTNWNLELMQKWLEDYHDTKLIEYLIYGWPLNAVNTAINEEIPKNQKGATEHPQQIRKYLADEIKNGSIIGPFIENPFGEEARFSPLDTRPKKDSEDLRVILTLSHPFKGASVNQSIDKEHFQGEPMELTYPTVDSLVKIIRKKGKGGKKVRIMKRDLAKAYRQMWMSPGSVHLLGYVFEKRLYYDVTLSMGSASSAFCCQRTSNAITHIFGKFGYENVNYLDYLGAAEEDEKSFEAYDCLGWILESIGIRESKEKACPPAFIVIFLGILFNTINMTLTITEERMKEILHLL